MQVVITSKEAWASFIQNLEVSRWSIHGPDRFPSLAIGRWEYYPNDADGFEFQFIELISKKIGDNFYWCVPDDEIDQVICKN